MKESYRFCLIASILIFTGRLFYPCYARSNKAYPECIKVVEVVHEGNKDYEIVEFGAYPQSKNDDGTYNVEKLRWKVVQKDEEKAFLICENVIIGNVPFYEQYMDNRVLEGKTIYPNNYEYSEVRAFLNGLAFPDVKEINRKWENKGFLQTAFTESEQEKILITLVDNSLQQMKFNENTKTDSKYICNDTRDKIFLLSESEINNPALSFIDDNSRIRAATDYAYDNMAFRSGLESKGGIWWVRSPVSFYASRAAVVLYTGEADGKTNRVRDPLTGVVPALWIELE